MPGGYEDSYISPLNRPPYTIQASIPVSPRRKRSRNRTFREPSIPLQNYATAVCRWHGHGVPPKATGLASAVRLAATISSSTSCMAGQEDDNKQGDHPIKLASSHSLQQPAGTAQDCCTIV
uniref:Uncharacterized protein n=1 Tax=Ditylenchus dipsaci TaxID=166011 RepID=A0A915ECF7_9BILA